MALIEMKDIKKRFGKTTVLHGVNLSIEKGEVHVLLGENGAGKSTLMKILSGVLRPDEGTICMEGREVSIAGAQDAIRMGIGMVYQELTTINTLNACENIYLGRLPQKAHSKLVDWDKAKKDTQALLDFIGIQMNPGEPLGSYSLGTRQLIEIAKAVARDAKLIIFDEPTSALSYMEVKKLFKVIKTLKNKEVSFVYITHKLDEVFEIGDKVSVLRDGRQVVSSLPVKEAKIDDLILHMVGRTITEKYPKQNNATDQVALEVSGLCDDKHFHDISFTLKKGEVLGMAGIVGSGRTAIAEAIFGKRSYKRGQLVLHGKTVRFKSPAQAIQNNIGLVTRDRPSGLLLHMPVYTNITVSSMNRFSKKWFRNQRKELEEANKYKNALHIQTPSLTSKLAYLSGGNQQKVALAKWLCAECTVLLMDDVSRGIDMGAKVEIYKLMNRITHEGGSIIFIASEMSELLGMCDRIIVVREGRITADIPAEQCTQELILRKATGGN